MVITAVEKMTTRVTRASAPGAVILGNEYQALGFLRQLRSNGVRCALVDQDEWGVARLSRYRCQFRRSPEYASDVFWHWLAERARVEGWQGWMLVPTDDEQVRQLAEHFAEASTLYRYCGPAWNDFETIYNKRLTYDWAARCGIATPWTFVPEERAAPSRGDAPYPLVVKPAIKRRYSHYSKRKAILAESPAQLERILRDDLGPVPVEDLLFQEAIPGDGRHQWSYAGFFLEGTPVAAFTACRRRQHPPDFGRASTYVVAVHDEEVDRESRRILALLGYSGLAEVEWKRDPRDGTLKFLEVNARCWGWHSLASRVVGNLPMMLYEYLVDDVRKPVEPHYGSSWMKWATDLPVAIDLLRRRELTLAEYVGTVRRSDVWCEWDRGDPYPLLLQSLLLPYLWLKRGY